MASATFRECRECGKVFGVADIRKYYGDGAARCLPRCVDAFEARLNETRGAMGGSEGRRRY